jgi:hypothetical protein
VEILGEAARNKKVAALFSANEKELKEAFQTAIVRAQLEKQIDADLSPERAADMLMVIIDGLSARAILDPQYDPRHLEITLHKMVNCLFGSSDL